MWWQWLIFALLMIIIPLSIVNLAIWVKKKNNLTNEQEKVMGVNMVKYTLFYWLCDLFYMSFIIESLACKFVFGGLIMLIILYNLSSAIINQTNKRRNGFIKFAIIQDFLVGIGIAIYLIYIISNIALQQIVLAIVAAVFGGLFTLVGVAWTIKKGDADRNAELKRIEIATVLARGTRLSVFDEPEAGIDLWSFNNLIKVFEKMYQRKGGSILIISHQERILNIADKIVVIADGKLTKYGTRDEILPELLDASGAVCRTLTEKII